jgi:protein-disulfide isomerase
VLTVEPQIIETYVRDGRVRVVFRDVLNHGERSERASEAAACAGHQGRFWEMHAVLFEKQAETWSAGNSEALLALMKAHAGAIEGIDQAAFAQCMDARATLDALRAADAEQCDRGITVQAVFEIGERRVFGAQPFEVMAQAIEAAGPSCRPSGERHRAMLTTAACAAGPA